MARFIDPHATETLLDMPGHSAKADVSTLPQRGALLHVEVPRAPITKLSFEGGGGKGLVYPDFYKVLEAHGLLDNVDSVIGSSAGAMMGLLVALGLTADEIKAETNKLNLKMFRDHEGRFGPISGVASFFGKKHGYYSAIGFRQWLGDMVEKYLGDRHATFNDLEAAIANNAENNTHFKHFTITATNYSRGNRTDYFNAETAGDAEIADIMDMAFRFPFVFERREYHGEYFGDGGVYDNDPGKYFNRRQDLPPGYGFTAAGNNPGTLAIRVDTGDELKLAWNQEHTNSHSLLSVIKGILPSDANSVQQFGLQVVQIPVETIGTLPLHVGKKKYAWAIDLAVTTAEDYVANYHDNALYHIASYQGSVAEQVQQLMQDPFVTPAARRESLRNGIKLALSSGCTPAEVKYLRRSLEALEVLEPSTIVRNVHKSM